MKLLIAPNALKGSLSAPDAAEAIREGVSRACPNAEYRLLPVADGGDGTAEVLGRALGAEHVELIVEDPLGRPVHGAFQWLAGTQTAVIDVATASGLRLLAVTQQNPLFSSSHGTGQLMHAAIERGARRIVLGAGGSATVDGGAGLMQALGATLADEDGAPIPRGGRGLLALHRLDVTPLERRLANVELVVLSDVKNPLLGAEGAAAVFGPQKGADSSMVTDLECGLSRLADFILCGKGVRIHDTPMGGAAGGIAASLRGLFGARLVPGIDWVLDAIDFDAELDGASWVITAEGHLDSQTLSNKAPFGVARRARARGVPVVALCGGADDDPAVLAPFDVVLPICRRPVQIADALRLGRPWLVLASEQLGRLIRVYRGTEC
jgi:glycerate kinase